MNRNELTRFQVDVLACAGLEDGQSGQDINRRLDQFHGQDIQHSRLYRNLSELTDQGLLSKAADSDDERANTYRLTSRGERELLARANLLNEALEQQVDGRR